MHRFVKLGLSLGSVFCLLTGPVWAQEDDVESTAQTITTGVTGSLSIVFELNPDSGASSFRGTAILMDNVFGSSTCSYAGTNAYIGEAEPPAADTTGVCDPDSAFIGLYGSYNYSHAECQREDTGQASTFDVPGTVTACIPYSCFEGPLTTEAGAEFYALAVGCTYPAFYMSTRMAEDGTWTSEGEGVQTVTIKQWEYDAASGVLVTRSTATDTGMVEFTHTIPEEELPANDVTIEIPGEGSTMSGVGVVSGWSCLGGELAAEFRNAAGEVIGTAPLANGSERGDTESVCGDSNNGFSATMNWNLLPAGAASIHLIQNGEELASHDFSVLALGVEFLPGMWMTSVPDFPAAGQSATVEWEESQQRFVVTEIN